MKLSGLSNAVSGKVVRLIGRELFDLKARGDIFFESPCMKVNNAFEVTKQSRYQNFAH